MTSNYMRFITVPFALITVAAQSAVAPSAVAQSGHIGVIGGATFSTLNGLKSVDQRTGAMGGLSLVLPLGGSVSLQPEALFVTKGAKGTVSSSSTGVSIKYAEVPVLLRFSSSKASIIVPHVYVGPYFGLQIDCTVQGSSGSCDDLPGVSTKSVDLGGIAGGGIDLNVGGLVLTAGARYDFGVSKVIEFKTSSVREAAKNGAFALYAGLSVGFGKK